MNVRAAAPAVAIAAWGSFGRTMRPASAWMRRDYRLRDAADSHAAKPRSALRRYRTLCRIPGGNATWLPFPATPFRSWRTKSLPRDFLGQPGGCFRQVLFNKADR